MRWMMLLKSRYWTIVLAVALIVGLDYPPLSAGVSANTTINFGETLAGAVSVAGEVDAFTFSASAGDLVLARMIATSGDLDPRISIQDEGGNTLCSTPFYANLAEIENCTLPDSGVYTLYAEDNDGADTGNYQIYLQRLNNPGNANAAAYGDTLPDSIAGGAELDTYTFSGTNGDLLIVRMVETSGNMMPEVRVYAPDGSLLCYHYGNSRAFVAGCVLPEDGVYSVLAGDYRGKNTGAYNVHIQKLNEPVGSSALAINEVKSGTLVAAAEMKAYTLQGNVGDSFIFRMKATSAGGLAPQMMLYDPSGTRVCSAYSTLYPMTEILNCQIASQGEHTLLVSDYRGNNVGNYDLHLARINEPADALPLPYAETQIHTTSNAVQLHTYTFAGQANDVVVAQVAVPDRSFSPQVRLYLENGTLVCQDYANTSNIHDTAWIHCILPQSATYVIPVGSYASNSNQGAGTYQLFFQRLTPSVNASNIRFEIPRTASITLAGEIDTYTFRAASGDVVTVKMSAADGTIDPYIRLYGIDGVKLGEAYTYAMYNDGEAVIDSCTLPFSGTYTLLASEYRGNDTGNYTLSLSCEGDSCGFPLVLDEKIFLPVVIRR